MIRIVLLFFTLFFITMSSTAQKVKGNVVDSKGSPIELANVVLLSQKDSTYLLGTVTDVHGAFKFSCESDSVFLRVSSIGYQTSEIDMVSFDGTVVLYTKEYSLNDVIIKANRPAFQMGKEGVITKVAGTVLSSVGTADEVLCYMPGVIKDDEQFNVFGKGVPNIYINGHLVSNVVELQNVKSKDIKSVEIIRTPGSQYGATVKSVIKIRTIPKKGQGFGVGVRSQLIQSKNNNLVEQIDFNYNKNGMYFFGMYRYDKQIRSQQSEVWQNVYSESNWHQRNSIESDIRSEKHEFTTGLNYDISSKHSIGIKYNISLLPYRKIKTLTTTTLNLNSQPYDRLATDAVTLSDYRPKHNINAYYVGEYKGYSIEVDLDYLFNKYNSIQNSFEKSKLMQNREVVSNNKVQDNLLATKIVMGHKLFGGIFKMGLDTWTNSRKDDYFIDNTELSNSSLSHLKENQIAPFVEYRKRFTFGDLAIGARYEYVRLKYNSARNKSENQVKKFSGVYPSLAWSYKSGKSMFSLNYAIKTRRPSYTQLSNNIQYLNRFTLQAGNPNLQSEHIHDITFASVWNKLQLSVSYQDDRNAIIYWTEHPVQDNSITIVKYKNINSIKSLQGIIAYSPVVGIWHPQLILGVSKQWLRLNTTLGMKKFDNPVCMFNFDNNLAWRDWIVNVDFNFRSKGNIQNQYITKNTGVLNIGVSKSFFHRNLILKMEGIDILNMKENGIKMITDKMDLHQCNKFDTRQFKVTLQYNFNTSKKRYKGKDINASEKKRL